MAYYGQVHFFCFLFSCHLGCGSNKIIRKETSLHVLNTVVHDFNGHEVNGIHGLNGKKCYDKALYLVNNRHDFKGMHDFKGNFPYDDFFRKTHARLYWICFELSALSLSLVCYGIFFYSECPLLDWRWLCIEKRCIFFCFMSYPARV